MVLIVVLSCSSLFTVVPAQVEKLVGGTHKGRTMGGMVAGGAGTFTELFVYVGR